MLSICFWLWLNYQQDPDSNSPFPSATFTIMNDEWNHGLMVSHLLDSTVNQYYKSHVTICEISNSNVISKACTTKESKNKTVDRSKNTNCNLNDKTRPNEQCSKYECNSIANRKLNLLKMRAKNLLTYFRFILVYVINVLKSHTINITILLTRAYCNSTIQMEYFFCYQRWNKGKTHSSDKSSNFTTY